MRKKKSAGVKYFGKPVTADPDDAPELLNDFFAMESCVMARNWSAVDGRHCQASRKPRSRFDSMRMSSRLIAKPARAGRRALMLTCAARGNSGQR